MTKFLLAFGLALFLSSTALACPTAIGTVVQDCNSFGFYLQNTPVGNVTWNFGDGVSTTAGIEVAHNYEANGLYTVTATFSGPDCPDGITLTTMVIAECAVTPICPTEIAANAGTECGVMNFEIGSFVDGENVIWYPGDETGAVTGGHFFSHTYAAAGTYHVCAFYTTPQCPNGVELCTDIIVESCTTGLCPTGVTAEAIDCDTYVLHVQGIDNATVIWNFNDGTTITGGINADHTWPANGVYMVTAEVDASQCPAVPPTNIITFVYTVEVNCATSVECPTSINSNAGTECGAMNFEIGSFVEGESVTWFPGDETGAVTTGHFFSHTYATPGTYHVCAFYTSPLCPNGVELCTDIVIEACNTPSCPTEMWSGAGTECGVMNFEIGSFVEGENVIWYPGDETGAVTGGHFFSHTYINSGTYQVCAFYTTPLCPDGVELCTEITVSGCDTLCNAAGLSIDSYVLEGGTPWLTYMLSDAASGQVILSGYAEYTVEDPYMDTTVCVQDGCYYLTIDNNNPLIIGQGINFSFIVNSVNLMENAVIIYQDNVSITWLISVNSDCQTAPSCQAAFEPVFTVTPGHIEFINNSTYTGNAQFTWDYGNGTTSDTQGGNVLYTSNGLYTVCLTIITDNCTDVYCQVIAIDNIETPCAFNLITLAVDGTYFEPVSELIQFQASANGLPVYDVAWQTEGQFTQTVELCVPDGCYEVQLSTELPLQALAFTCVFMNDNAEQLGAIELTTGMTETAAVVGVNMDCTINVDEAANTDVVAYPNPASSHINFRADEAITALDVYDMTGKLMDSFKPNQPQMRVQTAEWSNGIYMARVITASTTKMISIEITH